MKRLFIFLLAAAMLFAAACGGGASAEPGDGEYYIYYIEQDITGIDCEIASADGEDGSADLILTLLARMQELPESQELICAMDSTVEVQKAEYATDTTVYVYFNSAYSEMDSTREILCRAAIVKTLTQLESVDYVGFYINGQPLTDTSGTIALMTADSFVDDTGDDTADLQRVEMTLYYTDSTGSRLVAVEKTVIAGSSKAVEELVIEQLIAGVESETVYATLPATVSLLSISVKSGVCYVNLSSEFIDDALDVEAYIPVYSIVDSLTELSNISKVQISIEGSANIVFKDIVSLSQPLERDLSYVGSASEDESAQTAE